MRTPHRVKRDKDGTPSINQHVINGWAITHNPDDGRFHVAVNEQYASSAATFTELRNAVQWARTHQVTPERRTAAGLV